MIYDWRTQGQGRPQTRLRCSPAAIRSARKRLGYSQAELAEKMCWSASAVGEWETLGLLSWEAIVAAAKALETETSDIVFGMGAA